MSTSFDAIVVGAGPGGCAAAIVCRQHGLSTLLLEADSTPRDRPGETLSPEVAGILDRLGVREAFDRARFFTNTGHRVTRGSASVFQEYGALGYQARRSELDAILIAGARAAGADVRQGTAASEPLVEDGRTVGVRTRGAVLRARFTIDAAGPGHWMQRHLGLALLQISDPLIARFGWTEGAGDGPKFEMRGCGWRWEAPVAADRRAWVSLELDGKLERPGPPGRDVTWRMARPCAGAGYFLVGEAACVLDPACSNGVTRALLSGMRAGDAIARGESAVAYGAWMESWFCSDALTLATLYSNFEPPPEWLDRACEALRYMAMRPLL